MRTTAWKMPVALAALALIFTWTGTIAAQPGDLLEETRAKLAIEAQRLEKVYRDAERDAYRVVKTRPTEAMDILKAALGQIEDDNKALKPERRDQIKRALRNLIKDFEFEAGQRGAGLGIDPAIRLGQADARRAEEERRKAQAEEINRSLAQMRTLRAQGKNYEANRLQDELKSRFPDNPVLGAGRTVGDRADQLADIRNTRDERSKGSMGVLLGVERSFSVIPPDGQMMFPKDWATKLASKHRGNGVRMTEKEKAIMKALNTVISTDYENNTFQDVIAHLEKLTGQTIITDRQSMMDANVTYEGTQITCKHKATVRTILRKILGDIGLTYVVKDEVIQVVTPAKAKETLSARTYYVGDLLYTSGSSFGPINTQLQAAVMVNRLGVLITQIVEPDSWEINGKGGLGTIAFEPITMSFVIKQTAEVHYQMGFGGR